MKLFRVCIRIFALTILSIGLNGCDDPRVYGSIGISSYHGYGGYGGGPRVGGSISVGGRIY